MTNKILTIGAAVLFSFSTASLSAQQLKVPAPSPLQTIKQNFALGEVNVEYSRPSLKGRAVFGDLVPYDKIWRTGANQSSKIIFTEDVKIEGNAVQSGTYAIYTIPRKDMWEIMLYKDLTLGGNVADYKNENEVLRVKVKPLLNPVKVETFTFQFSDVAPTAMNLELMWDNVRVPLKITADIDEKVMKNIELAMAPADKRPYYQAASYYYDNNKDMKQALEWIDKAFAANPNAYWVALLKAKIQLKLKDNQGAIATAEKAMALAKADNDDTYVKHSEKLIAEAKKK
jgi:tetratricopeptide (TPR) repeat protein